MRSEELTTLAGTLVSLRIVFGSDRLIGYSFTGGWSAAVNHQCDQVRRNEQGSSVEMR